MPLRLRLIALVLLFVSAVLLNISALIFLARAVFDSLDVIERVRERQLTAAQLDGYLRDAEAALYRYQIEGERGFADQFTVKMGAFGAAVERYGVQADTPVSRDWIVALDQAHSQAQSTGQQLIALRDRQTADLQAFLDTQATATDLLFNEVRPARPADPIYQTAVTAMYEASRAMLASVTSYVASPDETKRGQFTEAAVALQQHITHFTTLLETAQESAWLDRINATAARLQQLGSQLIGTRDLQQSQFANFIALVFNASQQTIVGKIQPHEAGLLNQAQATVQNAVRTAVLISVVAPLLITLAAGWLVYRLGRQMTDSVNALLRGASRVAAGDLRTPVELTGHDEHARLAASFNTMMSGLASREERLRTLLSRMAQIQDEERRLIGLDLHDGLTQLMMSTNMHLNALNALSAARLDPQALQELDVSRSLIKQAIDEARKVIAELRPTVVDDFGLEEGLRRYVSEVSEAQHWSYEVVATTTDLVIAPAVRTAIFRI
ncbi:partial Signal transduction histidine-protein kinase/phosphatase DegS, partial [Gammaproteobacteria bacterium]